MLDAQQNPKPSQFPLTMTKTEEPIRLEPKPLRIKQGRGRSQFITRRQLQQLTSTSRIPRIRSIPRNQTTKQHNNTTAQTPKQQNTTPIGPNPNISKDEHIHKQTYTPQNSGEDTTFCVGDLLCGVGGCVVKWCAHRYSCVSYIVTVCIRGMAQSCRYIVAHSVVCSHIVKHLTTRQPHRQRIKTLPHSLTSHPISTHKKGGRGVVVRVLCWVV